MRVLVAEDFRSLADVLAEGLRDQGMAVDVAFDGLEAAARLDVNAYDVVVLDRDLPGIHGDTLCQMITARDDRVMVLMLTAAGLPGDRVSGLGLSIVAAIAAAHGGSLQLQARPEGGIRVLITLPLAASPALTGAPS